eukprot:TRINITY_DN18267_c0_g1_i1.p2 TRINITY_DN18267_c0_g1~~TRINITY_DN18267_c0_g1_i1.p2  ORF type:complete len:465 (+),score=119.36 TRINITY_DN18267_c0_g1_i1:75-1469(+)
MPHEDRRRKCSPSPRGRGGPQRRKRAGDGAATATATALPSGPVPKPPPPQCGGDAPATPFEREYFADLCRDELVEVFEVPGKGKGLRVTTQVDADDAVLQENALIVVQNIADARDAIPVCAITLRSLENPAENWRRVMEKIAATAPPGSAEQVVPPEPEMPLHAEFEREHVVRGVPCRRSGCRLRFVTEPVREQSERGWHAVLCRGLLSEEQQQELTRFEHGSWTQGNIDYEETFYVTLHSVAMMVAGIRVRKQSPAEAWNPFEYFAWTPWTQLATFWAAQHTGPAPEETLDRLGTSIRNIIRPTGDEMEVCSNERLDRLLGLTLLNAQERSPESPWGEYITWLGSRRRSCPLIRGRYDWRAAQPTDESNKLYYSASGQGLYRIHAGSNHSCDPSCEVRYSDTSDETISLCALRRLRPGDEVTISYVADVPTVPRKKRQKYLANNYRFDCLCARCEAEKEADPG